MSVLKEQYNLLLEREKKAEDFFNNASEEEAEKWMPEFQKIIVELSRLIYKIEKQDNKKMTHTEALEGFKEI